MLNRSDSTSEEGNSTADADDEKNGEDGGKNMAVLALNPPSYAFRKTELRFNTIRTVGVMDFFDVTLGRLLLCCFIHYNL